MVIIAAPYLALRIAGGTFFIPGAAEKAPQGAIAYLKRLHYDTALSASPYALSSLRELVDPSQILFGSDYPFASEFIVDFMVKGLQSFAGFGAKELAAIERGNAARMLPMRSR